MNALRIRAPLADPAFADLKVLILDRTGHHYYEDKDDQLWERIAPRMAALRLNDAAAYASRLRDPATGPAEWTVVESAITINETFFFRFAEQFDALRDTILPALIARAARDRRLRIWSVGCSTGAEAYSVAVLLRDLLGDALPDWNIAITGTDIDGDALAAAREGLFGVWALRTMDAATRARLFTAEGGRFRLKTSYRAMARFEHHNLLTLVDGTAPLQFTEFDLILCRNILIYFRPEAGVAIVSALVDRLQPAGWLLLGHAEPRPAAGAADPVTVAAGVVAYRPPVPAEPETALPPVPPPPPVRAPRRIARVPRPVVPSAPDRLTAVRHALSSGAFDDAFAGCAALAAADPNDPLPHYLSALAAGAVDDAARAEQGFRRALYLDSGFAMAHYMHGLHLAARGDARGSARALRNAGRVAATLTSDALLPEGEGMRAGELAQAVRYRLQRTAASA